MKIINNRPYQISGTIDDLTYFVINGVQYAKRKTTFKLKEKLNDPSFANCKKNTERLGKAAKLAKIKYATLSEKEKVSVKFGSIIKQVYKMIKEGKTEEEIIQTF